jgi:AmmeMemoRadiSam system protein B
MSGSTDPACPRLRDVDVRAILHEGRPSVLLRDPLQLSGRVIVIPQEMAPVLALCDGTRDADGLRAALAIRFGVRVGPDVTRRLLAALDEALFLDNERFAQARDRALDEYRRAPFREPTLAGKSYPADADELSHLLRGHLEGTDDVSPLQGGGRGLVCPHIDYARGGPVYARVWMRAAEMARAAERVVLLGTDHFGGDGRLALTRQHYASPLGVLPTAGEIVDLLAQAMGPEVAFADELHHRCEHSIELAAIWLQHVREGRPCELVPILCGSFGHFVRGEAEPEADPVIGSLVEGLRQITADGRTIVVAAADLSHVGPAFGGQPQGLVERAQVKAADEEMIARICAGDAPGFLATLARNGDRHNVCGLPPVYLALRLLAPLEGELVSYDRCPADEGGTSFVSICGVVLR